MRPALVQPQVVRPAPSLRPTLRVVPEPVAPPERPVSIIVTIALVVLAMLVGVTGGYVWQHRAVADSEAMVSALQGDVIRLEGQLGVQEGRMAESQRVVLSQQELIQGLRTRNANLHLRYQIAVGNELAAQQALAESQAQLQAANETVQTMVGPQLADGTYVGYLMAVGSSAVASSPGDRPGEDGSRPGSRERASGLADGRDLSDGLRGGPEPAALPPAGHLARPVGAPVREPGVLGRSGHPRPVPHHRERRRS